MIHLRKIDVISIAEVTLEERIVPELMILVTIIKAVVENCL